ncbi:hypothetical protein GW17_00039085 [Ensete ventricosum]|nr:hypothetical protein GW17_00039085 [Ensete ventricosum]
MEESLKSLSVDYLNLLINGQAFSDVTFSVEGRLVHAHRCVLAARSLFFRNLFCGAEPPSQNVPFLHHHQSQHSPLSLSGGSSPRSGASLATGGVIGVNSISYEVFLIVLQFLYSSQVSLVPQKHELRPGCSDRGCWHTHCTAAVDLALDTLAAARSFGVEQLMLLAQVRHRSVFLSLSLSSRSQVGTSQRDFIIAGSAFISPPTPLPLSNGVESLLTFAAVWHTPKYCTHLCYCWVQKQLVSIVENASIEDVMKVLIASRKQDMHQLWTACSHLVAKSGLPPEVLAKHLPIDVVAKIEEIRLKSSLARFSSFANHQALEVAGPSIELDDHHKIRRMRRALDSSDVELVKLMVMGEGLNLDDALALHYAVENCSREVVKALLELGAADVNCSAGPTGKTPLHIAAEMVCPDMVAVLLDHHADPSVRTVDGVTPLDILRSLTSEFLFKGAVPGLSHIEPNKLRLCLELVQSAALVMSREQAYSGGGGSHHHSDIYP